MRQTKKLRALDLPRLTTPGYYFDGGNLVLQVSRAGTKSWLFRYSYAGKRHEVGLGPLTLVSLADARAKAVTYQLQILDGQNPIRIRAADSDRRRAEAATQMTFRQCAERCIEDKRPGWKSAKHADQWTNTLETYAYPHIGALGVQGITTGLVRKCLDPIWTTKTETASRLRQRIEAVLDWAKVHGYRTGDNPAAWRGHLEAVMAAPKKIAKSENHAALPYARMGTFMVELHKHPGMAALALEFTIRTACRTGEVIEARWTEIDEDAAIWTIPAERMKAGVAHTVPLDKQALRILNRARALAPRTDCEWVFPGKKDRQALSNMAMLELLRGIGATDISGAPATVHGFRSTFRQWAAECSTHPREVAEHALAHRLPDKAEAAYQRSTLVEKRRALMSDWGRFIDAVHRR